jgi:hypothetical protein
MCPVETIMWLVKKYILVTGPDTPFVQMLGGTGATRWAHAVACYPSALKHGSAGCALSPQRRIVAVNQG